MVKIEVHWKRSHKKPTIDYKEEKDKVCGFLAKRVLELVKKSHGTIIPEQTIQRAVAEGTAVMLLRKIGNSGSILDLNFNHLKIDFESYIKINQINGKVSKCDCKHLQATIKK